MTVEKINHIRCDLCNKQLTHVGEDGEIQHDNIIDIKRDNKTFELNDAELEVIGINEKMLHSICDECFIKVLNESKTLAPLFYNNREDMFLI